MPATDAPRPAKGTPEWELWVAAIEVAIYGPEKHGPQYTGQVSWERLDDLRNALEGVGIDWRAVLKEDHKRRHENRLAADQGARS